MTPFLRHLFADHPTSGNLTLVGIYTEPTKRGRTMIEARCGCGRVRIVEASAYKRDVVRACKPCAKANHYGNLSRAMRVAHQLRREARQDNRRATQAEALLVRCIAAHQRCGIAFDYEELRREIEQEAAQYDFSDLLEAAPLTMDISIPSSLAMAEEVAI